MALLPNPDELQRVTPQPSNSVASYTSGIDAQSNIDTGQMLTRMAAEQTAKLDQLKTEGAETALMRAELELHTDYEAIKGDGVLQPDFHAASQDKYKTRVAEITGSLATPSQKARFQQVANRRSVAFDASRTAYAVGEADKVQGINYAARQQVLDDTARNSYAKPEVVAASLAQKNDAFAQEMIRKGIADPATLTALHKEMEAGFYSTIIQHAINNEDTETANAYFAGAKLKMSEQQQKHFKDQLDVGNNYNAAQSVADKALAMSAQGANPADIENYVRKNTANKEQYALTQNFLTEAAQAKEKQHNEALGGVYETFQSTPNKVQAKLQIVKSKEFMALTPLQRATAIKTMDDEIQQDVSQYRATVNFNQSQADRAKAKIAGALTARFDSAATLAEFSRAITDQNLASKSRAELMGKYLTTLGPAYTAKLLAEHKALTEGAKPITIDKTILEAAKPASLKKNETVDANDAYNGFVKSALMNWQQQHPGKLPTLAEQQAIAASANTEYTTPGFLWDSTHKAYEATPTGSSEEVATIKKGLIKNAAAKGTVFTPAELESAYTNYIIKHQK